jgi:hypothetical protein
MITTIFLLLLVTFEIWYLTSSQYKPNHPPVYVRKIISNGKKFRIAASLLFLIATVLLIIELGWTSGITAAIVGIMAAGSLIVVIQPFQYLRIQTLGLLYISVLLLEIFI